MFNKITVTVFVEGPTDNYSLADVIQYADYDLEGFIFGKCSVVELADGEAVLDPDFPEDLAEEILGEAILG